MIWPACFFFLLALILKRKTLLTDIKKAIPETSVNLQIILFNTIFITPLIAFMVHGMETLFIKNGSVLISSDTWENLPIGFVMIAAVFIGDFTGYWRHRLEHSIPFWPMHATHHSDTEMTWLTLERIHPINRITTFLIDTSVLLLLGFPPLAILINNMVRHYYGFFIHADLPWTYGSIFGKIFVSPAMHRWHHSADKRYYQCNFATVFAFFDYVFGTYKVPGACNSKLGVSDFIPTTLWGQISYAFKISSYQKLIRHQKKMSRISS